MRHVRCLMGAATAIAASIIASPCKAVLVYGGTGRNTDLSTVQAQGAQYEGQWLGSFTGTPIGPNWFVTANHVGGSVGSTLLYQGQPYTTTDSYLVPNTDLRLWRVSGTFSSYALLYNETTDGSLAGKPLYAFGRGLQPGAAVTSTVTTGSPGHPTITTVNNGWLWSSTYDNLLSWGTNHVDSVQSSDIGALILFTADTSAATEGTLADHDSGGGVFVQSSDGKWKLAGINYGVDPKLYSHNSDGSSSFSAGIFNAQGLYGDNTLYSPAGWQYGVSQTSLASSISGSYSTLQAYVPEPGVLMATALGMALLGLQRPRFAR